MSVTPKMSRSSAALLLVLILSLVGLTLVAESDDGADKGKPAGKSTLAEPRFDSAFWKHWGDGQAEVAGYDLEFPRYGTVRKGGTAVTIFVTETFSNSARVKADPGRHPDSETFPVMKLNLVQDFQTGIYDYNTMLSSFVALAPVNGRVAGEATKVSYASQEWCGHVYHQLLFDQGKLRSTRHSYFDGEADATRTLTPPPGAISEDALWHWARGLAAPVLESGESVKLPVLPSLERVRLNHKPLAPETATLSVKAGTRKLTVPAGEFEVVTKTAALPGRTWTFEVEAEAPHRLIAWSSSLGHRARLRGSKRMKYWALNGPGGEAALKAIGLGSPEPKSK